MNRTKQGRIKAQGIHKDTETTTAKCAGHPDLSGQNYHLNLGY